MSNTEKISFTVDAGIINRLGLELVSKSETALAELIKNAFDADAKTTNLYFINAERENGTLIIEDDGVGMNKYQLINGFMKLATTDKIHNSISELFKRPKAGRKGIGRFSTQRLGTSLEIITKSYHEDQTIKLEINWQDYLTDRKIEDITNKMTLNYKEREQGHGTTLKIYGLREKWSNADIKRVYRYVSDLIQPNFIKVTERGGFEEFKEDKSFEVNFYRKKSENSAKVAIADPQLMILNRSLATFSGYINEKGFGSCELVTKEFNFNNKKESLRENFFSKKEPYYLLKGSSIVFKVYYFIGGDRNSYYGITKLELKTILKHLDSNGGVKLYRNGFRVPKYGELKNDWLNIQKQSRIGNGIPFNNNRLLGFVQIIDAEGLIFEESAGREGLIEKAAFNQLQEFVTDGISECFRKFANWFRNSDEFKVFNPDKHNPSSLKSILKNTSDLKSASKVLNNPDSSEKEKKAALILIDQATRKIHNQSNAAISELEMLRILAGTGLTIGEFIHEIKQIVPSLRGYISEIGKPISEIELKQNLEQMVNIISSLESYMSYFDETISKNVVRQLEPIDLRKVIKSFSTVVEHDINRRNFELKLDISGRDLFTTIMHPSEWNTILQNLYSNAKKAILNSKSSSEGQILIKVNRDEKRKLILLQFLDNGNGILKKNSEKIFKPFFTTYTERNEEWGTGTGLGLYIISQTIKNRGGKIYLNEPFGIYKTNFSIEIPITDKEDLKKYGY